MSNLATQIKENKIIPAVILVTLILAIIFCLSGILHLLVRFLANRHSFHSSVPHSNRLPVNPGSDTQLQQLFTLHDIDALPVFHYKDITGFKEPSDCAVCLSEFSENDNLRLLPLCTHAFHIGCIDTWLLSNSTCPLCRGTLLSSKLFEQESTGEKRVFSVRLGKFKSLLSNTGETSTSSSTTSQLDDRRCYSLGSYQYVLDDSNLQVALSTGSDSSVGNKRDSLSVSKIWLWSKKGRFPGFSDDNVNGSSGDLPRLNAILPSSSRERMFR